MSDTVTIRYGNNTMSLRKSTDLVAVKLKPGTEARAMTMLAPQLSHQRDIHAELGGFQILAVKQDAGISTNETLEVLRKSGAVSVGTHVYETSDDGVPFVPTGQLYVECEEGAPDEEIQKLFDKFHLQIVEARSDKTFIIQVTPQSENPIKTAAALQQSSLIVVAEPDLATPGGIKAYAQVPGAAKSFVLPADELLNEQWHLRNLGKHRGTTVGFKQGADARVVAAWESAQTLGDPMVVIAVIDDGFDLKHPDLSGEGKIVAPMDFTRNSNDPRPDLLGQDWHGTACAGVALGNADSKGVVGAAPHCRLMPVRWGASLSDREIENWFGWVAQQGAWVVSCSWGAAARVFRLSTRATRAISRCARDGRNGLGCVICFAAGNDSRDVDDPSGNSHDGFAAHPDVIAVAACNSREQRSSYSNFGNEISVCAPSSGAGGWGITTTDVMGRFISGGIWHEAGYSPGAFTNDFGGTSSACPLVAGICGLLLSARPSLTAREVRLTIESTARKIGSAEDYDGQGHSRNFGFGCIDAAAALQSLY